MENLRNPEQTKQEQIVATCEALLSGDKAQEKQILDNLKMYREAGRSYRTSIFHENIPESEKQIAMLGDVYAKMQRIKEATAETKKEIAFLTFGYEQNGAFVLCDLVSDLDLTKEQKDDFYKKYPEYETNDSAADFNVLLFYNQQRIKANYTSGNTPIIGTGHSHPDVTESYGNYSLPDLNNFGEHSESINTSRTHNGQTGDFIFIHTVLPVNGDVDIMTFNKGKERYEKATKVYDLTGNQEVQNYTFKSPTELSKTATEREPDEDENDKIYSEAIDDFLFRHRFDI